MKRREFIADVAVAGGGMGVVRLLAEGRAGKKKDVRKKGGGYIFRTKSA